MRRMGDWLKGTFPLGATLLLAALSHGQVLGLPTGDEPQEIPADVERMAALPEPAANDKSQEPADLSEAPATDGPNASKQDASQQPAKLLPKLAAGAEVEDGVPVEISPLFALDSGDLPTRVTRGTRVSGPTYFR